MLLTTSKTRSRGISVLEILIALGILLVFLSFAAPSLSNSAAKAELRAAVENMEFSIHMARSTARQLETDVIMHLETNPREKLHSVTFSLPAKNARPGSVSLLQDLAFPPGIRLVSDASSVHFDSRGMVDSTTLVMLVSNQDDDVNQRLVIE